MMRTTSQLEKNVDCIESSSKEYLKSFTLMKDFSSDRAGSVERTTMYNKTLQTNSHKAPPIVHK